VNLTLAPYGYTGDNPLNRVDPAGLSWWDTVATGLGIVGLGLGIAAVVVTAPATVAVLTGLAIVVGGIAAGIGLGESAATCFQVGWGSSECGGAITRANLNTLFTAASARWLPDLKNVPGIAEQAADYLAGIAVDKIAGAILEHPSLTCQ
jgi:hypothetical protein